MSDRIHEINLELSTTEARALLVLMGMLKHSSWSRLQELAGGLSAAQMGGALWHVERALIEALNTPAKRAT